MTTKTAVERYIIDEIMIGGGQTKIKPDQSLLDSGILDSLALLRLIGFIEDRYDITVGDGEITPDNFESLESITAYIDRKRQG